MEANAEPANARDGFAARDLRRSASRPAVVSVGDHQRWSVREGRHVRLVRAATAARRARRCAAPGVARLARIAAEAPPPGWLPMRGLECVSARDRLAPDRKLPLLREAAGRRADAGELDRRSEQFGQNGAA